MLNELQKVENGISSTLGPKLKNIKNKNNSISERLIWLEEKLIEYSRQVGAIETKTTESHKLQGSLYAAD